MTSHVTRRTALGLATVAGAGAAFGTVAVAFAQTSPTTEEPPKTGQQARERVLTTYRHETNRAGGVWNSYISLNDDGATSPAVEDKPDEVVEAYSVNKIAVALAVLDKVDRGLLTLDQRVDVTASIVIAGGDGIFSLDRAYPSAVTLGHALAALLTISDDTAVRLCGLVCPARELNAILVAKGFPQTQVVPVANPNRFFLGTTTPREMHNLLQGLVNGALLSASSTDFLLTLLRSPIAFTDGIRRNMSSDERLRVATKAGWFDDGRNEAGIMFDAEGAPVLTYAMFAHGLADPDNFGATHPAVEARAAMGRAFFDAVSGVKGNGHSARRAPAYRPANGD